MLYISAMYNKCSVFQGCHCYVSIQYTAPLIPNFLYMHLTSSFLIVLFTPLTKLYKGGKAGCFGVGGSSGLIHMDFKCYSVADPGQVMPIGLRVTWWFWHQKKKEKQNLFPDCLWGLIHRKDFIPGSVNLVKNTWLGLSSFIGRNC